MGYLGFVEGGNTGKDLSFKKFEGGTSSSGDVGHVSGASTLFSGGNGVTSSDDGDGSLLLGQVSQDVDEVESSLSELLELEDTHGSVHDDGLALRESLLLLLSGLGTVVKSHPAIRDSVGGNNLGVGVLVELVGNDDVGRKKDLLSELVGLGHDLLGGLNVVVLNQRGTNVEALGLQESENHTSTDDNGVALVEESLEDGDLGGNLGSTDDGGHGLLSVGDGSIKVFELLGEQESTDRRLEELGNTLSGGVGTVGSTESVVDVEVEGGSKLLNETGLVLGLLLVETSVFKHDDISLLSLVDDLGDFVSNAVGGKSHLLSEEFTHTLGARAKGELVFGSILRTSQVRADSDDGTLVLQVLNGGDRRADTGIVGDLLSVKGDVDVATNENLLSFQFGFRKVFDGLLGLQFEVESGRGADSEAACIGIETLEKKRDTLVRSLFQ